MYKKLQNQIHLLSKDIKHQLHYPIQHNYQQINNQHPYNDLFKI